MPKEQLNIFLVNKKYQAERLKYITKGPYIWLVKKLYEHKVLLEEQILNLYLKDATFRIYNFFISAEDIKQHYIEPMIKRKRLFAKEFDKQKEKFQGYYLETEKALSIIDP